MFEDYEGLMARKLGMISDKRDKRQGSLIFDAMAPNAAESAAFYADLEMLMDRTFADTATGIDLTRRCAERGIWRKEAVKATFYGDFLDREGEVYPLETGERFYLEGLYYCVTGQEDGRYVLECETAGEVGNSFLGELLPVQHLEGLAVAELTELRTDGEDEEDDEVLRGRYMDSFTADAFGGNVADYRKKVMALEGVGGVKVYPIWNGGGTVKLVILDRGWRKPTEKELEEIQTQIDPQRQGLGYGIAPVGHKVTVEAAEEKVCEISTELTLEENAVLEDTLEKIKAAWEEYFLNLRKKWADSERLAVRISYLESAALEVVGVVDIQNTMICGQEQNLLLEETEIPVLGEIEVV